MPKPLPTKYRTTNWGEYNPSWKPRGSLLLWIDKEMEWLSPGNGKRGQADKFSDAAIPFCLMIKYRPQWRKVHWGIDAETLEIRAIEVTSNRVGNAQVLPDLLNQIPADARIELVSENGAYDTQQCHIAIAERDAEAIIPVRKNGTTWKENTVGAKVRNETRRAMQRLRRAIGQKWSGCHRRSLVETKMVASNSWDSASMTGPSTAKSPNCKLESRC